MIKDIENLPLYNNLIRIRVFSTITIIAFHCYCPYGNWHEIQFNSQPFIINCYNFVFNRIFVNTMLPVFFMISGILFYKKKNQYTSRTSLFWKKFDRLAIPYSIIFLLCYYLNLPNIGIAQASGHLWFIRDLFLIFCFSIICLRINEAYLLILGICMYITFIFISKYNIQPPPFVLNIMKYYIFFIGGGILTFIIDIYVRKSLKLL